MAIGIGTRSMQVTVEYVLRLDTTEDSLEVLGGKGRSQAKMATGGLALNAYKSVREDP